MRLMAQQESWLLFYMRYFRIALAPLEQEEREKPSVRTCTIIVTSSIIGAHK